MKIIDSHMSKIPASSEPCVSQCNGAITLNTERWKKGETNFRDKKGVKRGFRDRIRRRGKFQ